jgi:hypothetical protein
MAAEGPNFIDALNRNLTDPTALAGEMPANLRNAADVYSAAQVDERLDEKADVASVYSKSEVYTKSEADDLLDLKLDTSALFSEMAGAETDDDEIEGALVVQDGTTVSAPNIARFFKYDVTSGRYGADPDRAAVINTGAIQDAIDAAYDAGGGIVKIPYRGNGVYTTQESTDTTMLGVIDAGPVLASYAASSMVSLLLRSGVHLELDPGVTIECENPAVSVIGLFKMDGGGIHGRGVIKNVWDELNPSGAGHGIFTFYETDPNNDPMRGLQIEGLEISHVASYGLGMQLGFMEHNIFDDLWIHDTGADALDHKARPRKSDGRQPNNIFITRYRAEKYGRRVFGSPSSCCAIDARGPVVIDGAQAYNFNKTGENHGGFRLSAGLYSGTGGIDYRASSANAILNNFTVDGGDPSIVGGGSGFGVALLDSASKADNGFITNVDTGFSDGGSSSGYGSSFGSIGSNITVEGARVTSFDISADHVTLINPIAIGQIETFEEDAGNLTAGQTVFVSPRPFVNATVQVYKNGTLLTLTVDYTKGASTTTITMVSGVLATDVIDIVSPTPTGFTITGAYGRIINPKSKYVTTVRSIGGTPNGTYQERNPLEDGRPWFSEYTEASRMNIEAKGAATNINVGIHAKNDAGVDFLSRGARAARAANPADSCVNYVSLAGGIATTGVPSVTATGSDTNVDLLIGGKGSGVVRVGTHSAIAAETVTGYITIKDAGGTSRKIAVVS